MLKIELRRESDHIVSLIDSISIIVRLAQFQPVCHPIFFGVTGYLPDDRGVIAADRQIIV